MRGVPGRLLRSAPGRCPVTTDPAYTNFTACMHGIDPAGVKVHHDEQHNALWVYLSDYVSIRVELNLATFGRDRTDELRRDRDGLLRVAETAARGAKELGHLLDLDDEDQADEPGDDARRLDRIRVLLTKFDWEHDDRQLALEAIERIVAGGAS